MTSLLTSDNEIDLRLGKASLGLHQLPSVTRVKHVVNAVGVHSYCTVGYSECVHNIKKDNIYSFTHCTTAFENSLEYCDVSSDVVVPVPVSAISFVIRFE